MREDTSRFMTALRSGETCPGCGRTDAGCYLNPDGKTTTCKDFGICRIKRKDSDDLHHGNGNGRGRPEKTVGPSLISLLDPEPWRPFPLDALPLPMTDMASEIGRTMFVDPAAAALPMLTIAGACIGNTMCARMKSGYQAPAVIWSATVQRSGEKKTPVLSEIMRPIYERQNELAEEYTMRSNEYSESLARWKSTPKSERGEAPLDPGPFPHLYLSDATTEAIAVRLKEQPRGLALVLDELSALWTGMNQYRAHGGRDRENYLAFYDAGQLKIDRKGTAESTIFVRHAFVAITGMIQPGILARNLSATEFESGFVARFLLAAPPPMQSRWTAEGIPDRTRCGWRDSLRGLLDLVPSERPALLEPSRTAMELFASAHDRMESERHAEKDDAMRAARAKLIGAVPRIALIHEAVTAAMIGEPIRAIGEIAMKSAIRIVDWCTRETKRVYGLLIAGDDAMRIIESCGGMIAPRQLAQRCWSIRTVSAAEDYLCSLVAEGAGKWTFLKPSPKGGRPSRVFMMRFLYDTAAGNTESGVS
jgi:hypothetical protein